MRISDWSSDVCSSDVSGPLNEVFRDLIQWLSTQELKKRIDICIGRDEKTVTNRIMGTAIKKEIEAEEVFDAVADMMERVDAVESMMTERSEERRVGKESVIRSRVRGERREEKK